MEFFFPTQFDAAAQGLIFHVPKAVCAGEKESRRLPQTCGTSLPLLKLVLKSKCAVGCSRVQSLSSWDLEFLPAAISRQVSQSTIVLLLLLLLLLHRFANIDSMWFRLYTVANGGTDTMTIY